MDVVLGSKRQGSRIRPDPGNNDKSIAFLTITERIGATYKNKYYRQAYDTTSKEASHISNNLKRPSKDTYCNKR